MDKHNKIRRHRDRRGAAKGWFVAVFTLLLIPAILVGCSRSNSQTEPDHLSLQLNFIHSTEFAGYYVAQAKGFYAEENIEVEFLEGGTEVNAPEVLANGGADMAVLGLNLQQQVIGMDQNPVALAAVYQISPRVLFSLAENDIRRPHDMIGRRVAIKTNGWARTITDTLQAVGIDTAQIETVDEIRADPNNMQPLFDGGVDVWTGFAIDEVVQARTAGYDVNLIFPADYAVGTYTGLIVTLDETLQANPDLMARFVRASLRGWEYTIENNDESAQYVMEYVERESAVSPGHDLTFYERAVHELIPLIDTGQVPIGWIDDERWQREMGDFYSPDQPGYTMEYVENRE
jgi:NitT/TauT family transport system substrate-binding protein